MQLCGVLEVKCPFNCKDKYFLLVANDNSNFLYENDNEELKLKTGHAYYYQVQMRIKFAHAQYCDFLVWITSCLATGISLAWCVTPTWSH